MVKSFSVYLIFLRNDVSGFNLVEWKNSEQWFLETFSGMVMLISKFKRVCEIIFLQTEILIEICTKYIQLKSDETAQLLNKPYVNEVTLRGQKQPLKCC